MAELRKAREDANLSQYELADKLGKTQSYVGKLEMGDRRLDILQLRDICDAVGVPFLDFIKRWENALNQKEPEK